MNTSTINTIHDQVTLQRPEKKTGNPVTKSPLESLALRIARAAYAFLAYALSMVGLVYFILFVSDFMLPISVNSGPYTLGFNLALLTNIGLLLLFGLQHSVMARPNFKLWLKQYLDPSIERATYCLATGLILGFICCSWVPMAGTIWSVDSPFTVGLLRGIGALGWTITLIATFNLDHFELFGLRQAYCQFTGKLMPTALFKKTGFYRIVRHPIQTGILIGMWSVPTSTVSHLVMATGMTIYVFIGLYFEEKDLVKEFGQTYRNYKKEVGKVIPYV